MVSMVGTTKVSAQGDNSNALQISMGILALTSNFVNASSPRASMKKGGWSCPPRDFVKLNVDASFDHDLLRGTMGAVLRDEKVGLSQEGTGRLTIAQMC